MLKKTFTQLLENYTDNPVLINELWVEIEQAYSFGARYYHTLSHLNSLLIELMEVKPTIQNWEAVLFSLFYHDVIYDTLKSDNEQKSAELAKKRMVQLSVGEQTIACGEKMILATQSHALSPDSDINMFTDADLSILGQPWEAYSVYYKNVRNEYSIYPDIIYNQGRKKVLKHFLSMGKIFKTEIFSEKYEMQARQNIQRELEIL